MVVVQVMCVNAELKMRAGKIGKSSHKAVFCFLSEAKHGLKTWPEQLSLSCCIAKMDLMSLAEMDLRSWAASYIVRAL